MFLTIASIVGAVFGVIGFVSLIAVLILPDGDGVDDPSDAWRSTDL